MGGENHLAGGLYVGLESVGNEVMVVVGKRVSVFPSRVGLAVGLLGADPHVESMLPDNVVAQVPLAHVAAQVVLRNHLREDGNIGRQGELVHCRAGGVRVQTGHDGGAGRGAKRPG